ncbi:TPA: NAD-dependent epimerase/dehydratase family protein [Streptococcus suis]|nr:NAD-dependent epimerase/dehydratase family protein [Streptococcus suis]
MKRVLITGAGSYIGECFRTFCEQYTGFEILELDVKESNWKEFDFSSIDVVFHVAGIAHVSEKKNPMKVYDAVNRKLAIEVATLAKEAGVRQFVFMSTMSVYGLNTGRITSSTPATPTTKYGQSKYQAEEELLKLREEDFKLAIVRPPMVYGKESRGNFSRLLNLVKKSSFFFKLDNQRSMIYIEHLSQFIAELIHHEVDGVFFPQNTEYVSTVEMVKIMSKVLDKNILFLPLPLGQSIINRLPVVNKVFGTLTYDKEMSELTSPSGNKIDYCQVSFEDSIKESVL